MMTCISLQINDLADPDNKVVEMALAQLAVIDLQHLGRLIRAAPDL